jgi:cytochrome c-type biogenesis protein CcmH/NrfG
VAALVFGLIALPLTGCGKAVKEKQQAEATAEQYYAAIAAGDAEAAVGLMDPEVFERTPRERLVDFLRSARQRLGEYRGHTSTGSRVGTFVMSDGKTISRLVLTYRVRYSLHEADESLTFLTGDGPPRFVGVVILSPAMQAGG